MEEARHSNRVPGLCLECCCTACTTELLDQSLRTVAAAGALRAWRTKAMKPAPNRARPRAPRPTVRAMMPEELVSEPTVPALLPTGWTTDWPLGPRIW